MSQVTLNINGQTHTVDVPSDTPLLWALRDTLNLTGTKYSCGTGVCGTCTVLINGTPMRSCVMPAISMAGAEITTIEGLDPSGNHPVNLYFRKDRGFPLIFDLFMLMFFYSLCTYRVTQLTNAF